MRIGSFVRSGWSRVPLAPLPWWLLAVTAAAMVSIDYATGPYFQFPSAYILLVIVSAWFNGVVAGLILSLVLPLTRVILMEFYWHQPWDPIAYVATALTRMVIWSALAFMAARLADHERVMRTEVDALITLLPVCADCHMIRGTDDQWAKLDVYAAQHAEHFSPGLCPACLRARLPEHIVPD